MGADHENENVTDSGTTPARRHLVWSNEQVEKGSQIVAILAASPGGSHPDALECLVINFLKGLTETVDSFFNNINNINNLLTSCSLYLIVLLYIFLNRMFSTPPVMRCIALPLLIKENISLILSSLSSSLIHVSSMETLYTNNTTRLL